MCAHTLTKICIVFKQQVAPCNWGKRVWEYNSLSSDNSQHRIPSHVLRHLASKNFFQLRTATTHSPYLSYTHSNRADIHVPGLCSYPCIKKVCFRFHVFVHKCMLLLFSKPASYAWMCPYINDKMEHWLITNCHFNSSLASSCICNI